MKNTNYLKEELYELIKTDESIFDFIQESSLDGLWYWDLERPEEEWMNPKFWSVLGYDYRKMPHKASAWKDIIYPEDLKLATENFIKHCENPDHPYDQTVRYTHKNGSTVWIRCRGLAIRDEHGKPLRMLGAHQDITETKNKELLLQMKTDQLRNAQNVSKIGSWELDLKTNEVVWTEELYNMYGFDPALPPPPYTEQMKLFTPESWQILTSSVAMTKEQGIPYELELTTIRKDGSQGWMWVRGEAVFDESENIIGLRGVAQDISEKKILELEKESLIKRLNYALDASGDGIWDWTPSNGVTVFSKAWIEMLGYEVGELASLASEWSDRLHPDDVEWVFAAINNVTQTPENGDTFSHEYRFKNKAGDYLWILNKAKVVERNIQGEATRVVGTHTNITKEKEIRRQIEEAKEQAEAASKAKSEFLANMSHEIRTPMNAVLGMLQLVKTTELSRQQDDYTSKAQIAAKSLLNLINDILDYSKIEAGKLELECHPFQLDELMRELAVVLSPNLGKKNVELLFDIDTALPDVLRGDRLRLQQILVNLAGNAIKFTEVGEVVVRIQQLTIQNDICQMRVSVTDTGIGISYEQQQRVFDGFTQAEASTARKYGGSGLGLVISKQMIQLMGGELQLTSDIGSGSCFWFDLSLPIDLNPILEDTTHYSIGSDINVLIVDDNEAALEVLTRSVEQFGATVFKASSGDEALMQFTQCMEKKQTIHVVLMDYRMPGMDGLTAAREIKNRAGIDQVPMIVMVTAFGREEIIHAQQTGDSAFESYLTKPVTAKQLYSLLKQAIAGDEMALSTRILPTQSKLRLQGLHLLLVEDNEFNRLVATELLKTEGATVDVAIGGQEGIDAVVSGVTQYDLVLMDVQMPGIDGLEATKQIRAKPGFAQLPIIAMTANVYLSEQEACLHAGMNAHLGKPLDLEKIIECILNFAKPTSASVPEQQNIIAKLQDSSGADHKTLTSILKRFGGNATFYRRLITSFETNFEQQLLRFQNIVNEKDWDALLALLHTIKGTSGTAGLSSLYQMVCELETEFKLAHGRTDASCETLSVGLVSSLRQVAMSELSDIHRLLATSPEDSAATQLVFSTEEINLKLTQLKGYLKAGDLKAIDMAEELKSILKGKGSVQKELDVMSHAIETLDFEKAIAQLTSLTEKL
jgi:PAS domain S-box-containing protein